LGCAQQHYENIHMMMVKLQMPKYVMGIFKST